MGKNALQIPFLGKGVKYYTLVRNRQRACTSACIFLVTITKKDAPKDIFSYVKLSL
mgnify:CR=1 FL=1